MKNLILVSLFVLGFNHAMWADSPLTSTDISSGYKDVPIVAAALKEGALTEQLMDYLSVSENPIAVKIAIIHALSDAAKATVFFKHINSGNKYRDLSDFTNQASGDLLICMAYLKALENYFDVGEALIMAQSAKHKSPKSYTVHIICALIEAQKAMDGDWCNVYSLTDNVRKNTSLTNDMNDKAKEGIFSYMDLYKEYCNQFALYPKQNADGKYGYVNDAGETVIDYQFDGADDFAYGYARVWDKASNKYGAIDSKGVLVFPFQFQYITPLDGIFAVQIDEIPRLSFIDASNKLVFEAQYEGVGGMVGDNIQVKKDDKWLLIDKKGNIVDDNYQNR